MSVFQELRKQLKTSVPATASMLLYRLPWLISLSFVGTIGAKELAAAALATTLANVTGMSLSVGLSSALTTLAGQARGELLARGGGRGMMEKEPVMCGELSPLSTSKSKPPEGDADVYYHSFDSEDKYMTTQQNDDDSSPPILPLVYLYRGIFINLGFAIPIGLYWVHGIKPLLLYLGQGDELSTMTEQYLRLLVPGLCGFCINFTLTTFLQTMELAHLPAFAALSLMVS